jgi:hypothetical protein
MYLRRRNKKSGMRMERTLSRGLLYTIGVFNPRNAS